MGNLCRIAVGHLSHAAVFAGLPIRLDSPFRSAPAWLNLWCVSPNLSLSWMEMFPEGKKGDGFLHQTACYIVEDDCANQEKPRQRFAVKRCPLFLAAQVVQYSIHASHLDVCGPDAFLSPASTASCPGLPHIWINPMNRLRGSSMLNVYRWASWKKTRKNCTTAGIVSSPLRRMVQDGDCSRQDSGHLRGGGAWLTVSGRYGTVVVTSKNLRGAPCALPSPLAQQGLILRLDLLVENSIFFQTTRNGGFPVVFLFKGAPCRFPGGVSRPHHLKVLVNTLRVYSTGGRNAFRGKTRKRVGS